MKHLLYNVDQVAEALRLSHGVVAEAARRLGCTRGTVFSYIERFAELKEVVKETREKTLDLAESELFKHITAGNMTAIIFYLKCQGKHRGYIERGELVTNPPAMHSLDEIDAAVKAAKNKQCRPQTTENAELHS